MRRRIAVATLGIFLLLGAAPVAAATTKHKAVKPTISSDTLSPKSLGLGGGAITLTAQTKGASACSVKILASQGLKVTVPKASSCSKGKYVAKLAIGKAAAKHTVTLDLVAAVGDPLTATKVVYVGLVAPPVTPPPAPVTTTTTPAPAPAVISFGGGGGSVPPVTTTTTPAPPETAPHTDPPTATSLAVSLNPIQTGQDLTLIATVSSLLTATAGTVSVLDGTVALPNGSATSGLPTGITSSDCRYPATPTSPDANGEVTATCDVFFNAAANYVFSATFSGDPTQNQGASASAPLTEQVNLDPPPPGPTTTATTVTLSGSTGYEGPPEGTDTPGNHENCFSVTANASTTATSGDDPGAQVDIPPVVLGFDTTSATITLTSGQATSFCEVFTIADAGSTYIVDSNGDVIAGPITSPTQFTAGASFAGQGFYQPSQGSTSTALANL